jgi:hypothetical protein
MMPGFAGFSAVQVLKTIHTGIPWTCDELQDLYGPEAYIAMDVLGKDINLYVTPSQPRALPLDRITYTRLLESSTWTIAGGRIP